MSNVTQKTEELVRPWIATRRRVERLKAELATAENEARNATNALGKWLCPDDSECGEKFNIWYGSGVLEAVKNSSQVIDFSVRWRREPDGKDRLEMGF